MINNILLSRHFLSLQWEATGLQSQFVLYSKRYLDTHLLTSEPNRKSQGRTSEERWRIIKVLCTNSGSLCHMLPASSPFCAHCTRRGIV